MTLTEAFNKAKDNEYIFHFYNGRNYKKSEIVVGKTELEFFYALSDDWEVKKQEDMDNGNY